MKIYRSCQDSHIDCQVNKKQLLREKYLSSPTAIQPYPNQSKQGHKLQFLELISKSKSEIPEHSLIDWPEMTIPKCSSTRAIVVMTANESQSISSKVVSSVKAESSSSRASPSAIKKVSFFPTTSQVSQNLLLLQYDTCKSQRRPTPKPPSNIATIFIRLPKQLFQYYWNGARTVFPVFSSEIMPLSEAPIFA